LILKYFYYEIKFDLYFAYFIKSLINSVIKAISANYFILPKMLNEVFHN